MRRGTTMVETVALLAVAGIVLGGGMGVIRGLHGLASADASAGTRAERACALLRRDLATGNAQVDGTTLRIALPGRREAVWNSEAGSLMRDGRILAAVTAFAPAMIDGHVRVDLTPTGLPPRRIEAWR